MAAVLRASVIAALLIAFQCCAPSRFVKPLAKNKQAVSFSFGGPMIKLSNAIAPMPLTTFGYGYGLTNAITGYANLHTTSLLFGDVQTDIGATFKLFEKENTFGISASPALQLAYSIGNTGSFKVWPSADINAYYHLRKKPSYAYAGLNSWFELSNTRAYGQPQQRHAIPNIHVGYTIVKTKWQHQFELGYLGIGIPSLPNVVDYIGVSGKGTLGIYYSLIRKF
jgi:hypothetical protein